MKSNMTTTLKNWFKNGDIHWKIVFYSALVISIILICISFFLPPTGVIDSSVFAAVGELGFFPALYSFYTIIMSGRKASLTRGSTTVSVGEENPTE